MQSFNDKIEAAETALSQRSKLKSMLEGLQQHEGYLWLMAQVNADYAQKQLDAIQPSSADITDHGRAFIAGEAWALRRVVGRVDVILKGIDQEVKELQRMVEIGEAHKGDVTATED